MNMQLNSSSELMTNFLPSSALSVESNTQFQAIQSADGNGLLFYIGSDGNLYLTQEIPYNSTSGNTIQGWITTNLTESFIQSNATGAVVKDFSIAQNYSISTISLCMVISLNSVDQLCVWLNCSAEDSFWNGLIPVGTNPASTPIAWEIVGFDDSSNPQPNLSIYDLFLSEVTPNTYCSYSQFIVVDILESPGVSTSLLRYSLDPANIGTGNIVWQQQPDANVVTGTINCIGRVGTGTGNALLYSVDGIYTASTINSDAQLNFYPALASIGRLPLNPTVLNVQEDIVIQGLTCCRNTDESTDLYFTALNSDGSSSLYYTSANDQQQQVAPVLVSTSTYFAGVSKLFAFEAADTDNQCIIVWGLSSANQIFYCTCPIGQQETPASWSTPMPVLSGVDAISPYVNAVSNGNTIYALGGNELFILTRSPQTTIWNTTYVHLPMPTDPQNSGFTSLPIKSYTTTIQLLDENGTPVANSPVLINTTQGSSLSPLPGTRTSFYVNYQYCIIDNAPLSFMTDNSGTITLIEAVQSVRGTQLIVSATGVDPIWINPMNNAINKLNQVSTSSGLSSAVITNIDGSTQPLVPSGTSQNNIDQAAAGFATLLSSYNQIQNGATSAIPLKSHSSYVQDIGDTIATDIGDLFNLIKEFFEEVLNITVQMVDDIYHLLVTIGSDIYSAVLDTVEKIAGAIDWILSAIKVGIDDVIGFLEFLFDWSDFVNTKNVVANIITIYLNNIPNAVNGLQTQFDSAMTDLQQTIASWGDLNTSGLGKYGSTPLGTGNTPPPCSASQSFLTHHFQNNASNLVYQGTLTAPSDPDPLNALKTFMLEELNTVEAQFETWVSAFENMRTDSVSDFLKQLVSLIAEIGVEIVTDLVDLLFQCLETFSEIINSILTCPIYIPVVSDILLNYFNIQSPSIIDVLSYIVAIPSTLVYKLVFQVAPFPSGPTTTYLSTETDFNALVQALNASETSKAQLFDISPNTQYIIASLFHGAAGILGIAFAIVDTVDSLSPFETEFGQLGTLIAVGIIACQDGTNILVPRDPIQSTSWEVTSYVTLGIRAAIKGLVFYLGSGDKVVATILRAPAAIVDAIMAIPAAAVTTEHIIELANEPNDDAWASAIFDECSNISNYIGRVAYAVALYTDDKDVKAMAATCFAGARVLYSTYQIEESVLESTQIS